MRFRLNCNPIRNLLIFKRLRIGVRRPFSKDISSAQGVDGRGRREGQNEIFCSGMSCRR